MAKVIRIDETIVFRPGAREGVALDGRIASSDLSGTALRDSRSDAARAAEAPALHAFLQGCCHAG